MVKIDIRYMGDLRCEAKHGPSGATLVTDAPTDNMGKGESFSPTDLVATGLGTCMLTIMGIMAQRHGIDLSGTTVNVEKEMSADTPRRIVGLPVRIQVPREVSEEDRQRLENAAHTCPVHKSIRADINSPVTFVWGK